MQFDVSSSTTLEPGGYIATLEAVNAYTSNKYQSDDLEPLLQLTWQVETDEGKASISDLVRVPRNNKGAPVITEKSKILNRLSSLFGKTLSLEDIKRLGFSMTLPDGYNTVDGLLALPHFSERKEEGFTAVKAKSLSLGDAELIGRQAQISVVTKNEYSVVDSTMPLPRSSSKPKMQPIDEDDGLEELPV